MAAQGTTNSVGATRECACRAAPYRVGRHSGGRFSLALRIVKHRDEEQYGTYRTKDTVLGINDEMTACDATGRPYASPVDPPPGQHP
jgi:hypothetical protein